MQAASAGNIGLVQVTLRIGADISMQADDGSTALHCAVKTNQFDMIKLLLRCGAPLEVQNLNGRTPLHEAILNSNEKIFNTLLRHGANLTHSGLDDIIKNGFVSLLQHTLNHLGGSFVRLQGRHVLRATTYMEQASLLRAFLSHPTVDRKWITQNGDEALYAMISHGRVSSFR